MIYLDPRGSMMKTNKGMKMSVNWVTDVKGSNDAWIAKFKSGNFSGSSKDDVLLFFKALIEFGDMNEDYREVIEDSVLQYEEVVQYYEVRDTDIKLVLVVDEGGSKAGIYTGKWKDIQAANNWKNPCQMEMIPEAIKQIMSGNPNTDSFFFAGTLTVDGPIKLAVLGREWISTYYEENGIDI